jgi:Arc/MetJ-type ribon-helix-helix transcriptional regulator
MLLQKKVQIAEEDWGFIDKATRLLNYKSKSEYMRQAILEKIQNDKRKLREMKRQLAMKGYSGTDFENIFEELEGDGFEDW